MSMISYTVRKELPALAVPFYHITGKSCYNDVLKRRDYLHKISEMLQPNGKTIWRKLCAIMKKLTF